MENRISSLLLNPTMLEGFIGLFDLEYFLKKKCAHTSYTLNENSSILFLLVITIWRICILFWQADGTSFEGDIVSLVNMFEKD